jgi:hypothetical protein
LPGLAASRRIVSVSSMLRSFVRRPVSLSTRSSVSRTQGSCSSLPENSR